MKKILSLTGYQKLHDYLNSKEGVKSQKITDKIQIFYILDLSLMTVALLTDLLMKNNQTFLTLDIPMYLLGIVGCVYIFLNKQHHQHTQYCKDQLFLFMSNPSNRQIFWHEIEQTLSLTQKADIPQIKLECEQLFENQKFGLFTHKKYKMKEKLFIILEPLLKTVNEQMSHDSQIEESELFFSLGETAHLKTMTMSGNQ